MIERQTPRLIRVQLAASTTPWDEERSPKEVMQLLGFLCESNLLDKDLGAVSLKQQSCSTALEASRIV